MLQYIILCRARMHGTSMTYIYQLFYLINIIALTCQTTAHTSIQHSLAFARIIQHFLFTTHQ
jgi:hypothetical protein